MIRFRDLTRLGKAIALGAAVLAAIMVFALAARWWDDLWAWFPGSDERRLDRAEARLEQAQADLAARRAEVAAHARQAVRVEAAHHTLTEARGATARATALAEEAPDATDEIDPVRTDRLRDADRRLCELSPDLCAG